MIEYGEVKLSPSFIMDEHPYSDYQFNMYLNSDDQIEITKTPVSMTEPLITFGNITKIKS